VRKKSGDTDAIDYVYGADYLGNIWRFDLYPTTPAAWDSGRWIYSSSSGRNITAEISVGAPPTVFSAGAMIYFGTGRYLSASDTSDTTTVHALYGIYDAQTHSSSTTALISTDSVLISGSVNMASSSADTRSTTMPSSWWLTAGNKGWVVPLSGTNVQPGERVIAPPVRYTQVGKVDALLFTSIVPGTDECVAGLDTWITAVDPLTGASAPAFKDLTANSVKVVGGSPRGVFVLSETRSPTLYISQTVFNISAPPTSSYSTLAGGSQTVCINGVCGQTRVLGINLTPGNTIPVTPTNRRQVWRQLK
jgi:type IV pilus assembly protein PilY1